MYTFTFMLSFTYVRQERENLDLDFDQGFDNLNDFLFQNQDEGQKMSTL